MRESWDTSGTWDMSDATTPPVRAHRDFEISNSPQYGVVTLQFTYFSGVYEQAVVPQYNSYGTPPVQGHTLKFQTTHSTIPQWVVNSRGCTNKPSAPDGSLPGGNHGICQMQLVHLLYEATKSFEISHSQIYCSYGSGM